MADYMATHPSSSASLPAPPSVLTSSRAASAVAAVESNSLASCANSCSITVGAAPVQHATRVSTTGACTINRPCAQQYVGKYQSCMVISGRLIVHAPVKRMMESQSNTCVLCGPMVPVAAADSSLAICSETCWETSSTVTGMRRQDVAFSVLRTSESMHD